MTRSPPIPLANSNAQVLAPLPELDFYDSQTIELPKQVTPLEAWTIAMAHPMPLLRFAFYIRDQVSALFGVQKINGFTNAPVGAVSIGDKLDFFRVEYVSGDTLSLSAYDTHLDVLTCISTQATHLTITSSVQIHNAFGRAYMWPVGPAHKFIVRLMLRRIRKHLA